MLNEIINNRHKEISVKLFLKTFLYCNVKSEFIIKPRALIYFEKQVYVNSSHLFHYCNAM